MSFDLAVFDPAVVPQERPAFLTWFKAQTQWEEEHGYDDPAVSTPSLRGWFLDMIKEFPQLNGPYASATSVDDDRATDYSVGRHLIYAAFRWTEARPACEAAFRLAGTHGIGFFDVSSQEGGVWLPDAAGRLVLRHSG
jgi:hypothetical protein